MRNFLKIAAITLIIIGTIGILLNEFVWEHSFSRAIIFAVVNLVGLVNMAFAYFAIR